MMNKGVSLPNSLSLSPPHGVVFVHGAVLQEFIQFYIKKGYGVKVDSIGKGFKLIFSNKLRGIKYTKAALSKLQGSWVYPYSYTNMAKTLMTHEYNEGKLGQFFTYKGRYWQDINKPYNVNDYYEA
jgi:hypothetical protein